VRFAINGLTAMWVPTIMAPGKNTLPTSLRQTESLRLTRRCRSASRPGAVAQA
jgi:hypothetical protein